MSVERALHLIRIGRHSDAEREYRYALAAAPNDASIYGLLAHCLLAEKKFSEAVEAAREAISLRPDLKIGYSALASVCMCDGRLAEGAQAIARAIELDPLDASDRGVQAVIKLKLRDWPGTLQAADAGLAINPHQESCVNARGVALAHLGRFEAAIDGNATALNHNPESAIIHANQGWALLRFGKRAAAAEHFRESLRLNPNSTWAESGLRAATGPRRSMLHWWVYAAVQHLVYYVSKMQGKRRR
jgi:tetratricopeptide (TPR) repeat protein